MASCAQRLTWWLVGKYFIGGGGVAVVDMLSGSRFWLEEAGHSGHDPEVRDYAGSWTKPKRQFQEQRALF